MRKRYLNQDELGKLFRAIRKGKNERDIVAYRLVLLLGLRVQELCNLTVNDVDIDTRSITVHGIKNGRIGTYTNIDEKIFSALKRYIRKNKIEDKIFPVGKHTFQTRFKVYSKAAGIGDFSIHALRHSCAILMVENGSSAIEVMIHLRHKNIQSSQVYFEQLNCERNFARTQSAVLKVVG